MEGQKTIGDRITELQAALLCEQLARFAEQKRRRIANGDASREFEVKLWLADYPLLEDVPRRYFREVEYVDRYLGELLRTLKSADLYDSSLIVFTSDHGEALGERGWAGHVETLFDELVHVPLIVKPPRGYPDGDDLRERVRSLVRHVDVVPTVRVSIPTIGRGGGSSSTSSSIVQESGRSPETTSFTETLPRRISTIASVPTN